MGLLAAFAPAGLVEGVAGSALKEGLTEGGSLLGDDLVGNGLQATQKVEAYAKAVDAAKKAQMAGKPIGDAVATSTGGKLQYQEFLNYGQYLRNQGMQETDILPESFARRVASQGLRKAGVSDSKALAIAKSAETLVNAGFALQQLQGAIYAYPRVADLLAHGDTDDAAEYIIEAGAGTIFGGLGAAHAFNSVHTLLPGVNEKANLPLSDETEAMNRVFGHMTGELAGLNAKNASRYRSHLVNMLELAEVNVPAGLRTRENFLPGEEDRLEELKNKDSRTLEETEELNALQSKEESQQKTSLLSEISSAWNQILTSKADREKLLDKQKLMFFALDTGNDRNHAHQALRALAAGTGQEDWLRDFLNYKFIPPKRTIDNIQTEQINSGLAAKAEARAGRTNIDSLKAQLNGLDHDLKQTETNDEANAVRQRIQQVTDQRDQAVQAQEKLEEEATRARMWEPPVDRLTGKPKKETPDEKEQRVENAFFSHYRFLNDELNEAAKPLDPKGPNALDQFNNKVKAMRINPADIELIAEKYPHFRRSAGVAVNTISPWQDFVNSAYEPQSYIHKLQNPELIDRAEVVDTPEGKSLAIPVDSHTGGARRAGNLDYTYSEEEIPEAEKALEQLKERPEDFPNPRLIPTGNGSLLVHWGEDIKGQETPEQAVRSAGTRKEILRSQSNQLADSVDASLSDGHKAQAWLSSLEKELEEHNKKKPSILDRITHELNTGQLESLIERAKSDVLHFTTKYNTLYSKFVESMKEYDKVDKEHSDLLRGEAPVKRLPSTKLEEAHNAGEAYGYKPEEIKEYLDERKQFFKSPNPEALREQTKTPSFKRWFGNSQVVDHEGNPLITYHGTTSSDWETFDPMYAYKGNSLGFHAGSLSQAHDFVGNTRTDNFETRRGRILPVFLSIKNPLRISDQGIWNPARLVAELSRKGIRDPEVVRVADADRPAYVPRSEWDSMHPSQRRLQVSVAEDLSKLKSQDGHPFKSLVEGEIGELGLPIQEDLEYRRDFHDARLRLENEYIKKLLEDHGYDGLVYKNNAEGEMSKGTDGNENSGDSYIALHPNQIKSATGNNGNFSKFDNNIMYDAHNTIYESKPDPEELNTLKKAVDDIRLKRLKADNDADFQKADRVYTKLRKQLDRLEDKNLGEVHKLPNGDRITYLSDTAKDKILTLIGVSKNAAGFVLDPPTVRSLLNNITEAGAKGYTSWNDLIKLVQQGLNKDGSFVSASAKGGGWRTLSRRLHTVREELIHGWQSSLGSSFYNHLPWNSFRELYSKIPSGMMKHLNTVGYQNFPEHMKVIEAAAKMMATEPEEVMMSRQTQAKYHDFLERSKTIRENPDVLYSPEQLAEYHDFLERSKTVRENLDVYSPEQLAEFENERQKWDNALRKDAPEFFKHFHKAFENERQKWHNKGQSLREDAQEFLKHYLKAFENEKQQWDNSVQALRKDAHEFLKQYHKAIVDAHGLSALDNLKHTTTLARHWNEEFTNVYNSRPGQAGENIQGSGAGSTNGGNMGGGTPPRPPRPRPDWDNDPEEEDWRKKFPPSTINGGTTSAFPTEPWQDGPQHPALPANLVERVNKAKARQYSPEQIDYIRSILKAYAKVATGLSDKEKAMYDNLRKADDKNWDDGYNSQIIHSIVDNHIHHIWGKDPKKGYPAAALANSGAFAINAIQARHRSWGTAFEGILDGRQLAVHDPASIIAYDADNIAKAATHRKALEILQESGMKDPEGMPGFIFHGSGRVVPSEDGTPSSILVNPNVVKNINMKPLDVERLKSSGLIDTYLRDGRVKDITPYVKQANVLDWIDATKKKIQKMIEQNPLLAPYKDEHGQYQDSRPKYEAGWGQLTLFAKEQAQKISEYLSEALDRLKSEPTDAKGNYGTIPPEEKPKDFNGIKLLSEVLHGSTNRLTPADMERLEKYLERNQNYAQGLSGDGESLMETHEVSRLIRQEKEHIDPELKAFLDEHHDLFSRDRDNNVIRTAKGDWSRKGLNTAIYHIAHAATNEQYPRLLKDMADLDYVNKVLTSANPITQAQHKEEALQRLKDINDRQPKQYVWAPKSHIGINHPAFTGYKWMATAADGTPTLAESDMAVSRHFYKYVVNRLGLEPSWLRNEDGVGKVLSPLLKAGAQVKSTILSGSPFHVIQIALRALMLHVNPFVRPNPIADIDENFQTVRGNKPLMRLGVENSLTLFQNRHDAEDYSVGVASHGGLVSKIPFYGPFTDQIHDFLFNRFIPAMKADSFRKMFDQYAQAHPDWTDDAVAYHAAQHTNNAFGGVNWREMGRSSTTQDWFNLVALAPDWLESEMRYAAGLFNGYGIGPGKFNRDSGKNFTRIQVGQAAVVLWTVARLINQLYSGSPHYESPFGLVVKDKDGRDIEYSVRTMPTDILHAATDPMGFLVGRASPLARSGEEVFTGRNQYGQKLTDSEKYVDLLSNLVPIWGQAQLKQATHLATSADVGSLQQGIKAAGATANVYRSPAQKTAANLASERSEEGSMNPAKIARHRLLLQLEDNLRNGQITNKDLSDMVDLGNLPLADAKAIVKNVKETAGEDPETARMYSRVTRLDFAGAVAVWDDANPSEKQILEKLIVKKAKAYLKKSRTDFTPDERDKDPMFKRARRIAPAVEEEE